MIAALVQIFGSVLGLVLGAVIVVAAARAGLWGLHAYGTFAGCAAFLVVLLGGTGLLYLLLGSRDNDEGGG